MKETTTDIPNAQPMSVQTNDWVRASLPQKTTVRAPYRIVDGIILSEACEINAAENCNLACRACSHLSPIMQHRYVDPDEVEADLSLLAPHYRVSHVRIVGGEPLLHARLADIAHAIRRSGVTDRVRVITNGTLLIRMTDEFWRAVDEVHVSLYPTCKLDAATLHNLTDVAAKHDTALVIKRYDKFREAYSEIGTTDQNMVQRIYKACQIAHVWRCHTVSGGYFYRCPQSLFLSKLSGLNSATDWEADRIPIRDHPEFGRELLDFLESPQPLHACSHCLGSVGCLFDHAQVQRKRWRELQSQATEALVDWEHLRILEQLPDSHNGCFEELSVHSLYV